MMLLSINYLLFFLNKMAKMIKINPEKATTGPTVIRRVLKISGLNSVPVVEPVISAKPKTIMAKPMAINIKLIFFFPNIFFLFCDLRGLITSFNFV